MPRLPLLRAISLAIFVWLAICASSCQRRHVAVPAPAPSAPAAARPASQAPAPAASNSPTPNTPEQAEEPGTNQVNKPPQAAKKPARPPSTPAAAASSASPATPAADPPKLGDIISPDEQKQLNAAIDQSLSRAQASLNSVGSRQLNQDQQADVEQIRKFMDQAKATRTSDPAGAKSLAQRAEILARDLAARFR